MSLYVTDSDNFNVYISVSVPIEIRTQHLPPSTLQQPACVFLTRIQFQNYCILRFSFCLMTHSLLRLVVLSGHLPCPSTVRVRYNCVMKRKEVIWRNNNLWTLTDDNWSSYRLTLRNVQGHHIEIKNITARIQSATPKYCSYYMHLTTQHKRFSLSCYCQDKHGLVILMDLNGVPLETG